MVKAMPVTPRSSHELRPETTAERATTNRCIFRPPRKNSLSPSELKRADQKPIPMRRTR